MNKFPCTHPGPCTDSKIHPGGCGTQEIHDAALGCIDGHYSFNPKGNGDVGDVDTSDGDQVKTGWTGNSEQVIGEMSAEELEKWDELDQSGKYTVPPEPGGSFGDDRDDM